MKRQFARLGQLLKEARLKAGLSQNLVAKKLGYTSPQFISNVERGLSSLPLKNLKLLIEVYQISAREVLEAIHHDQQDYLKESMNKLRKVLRQS